MQTFYGEWQLEVIDKQADFSQRFIISGSDSSDGIYDIEKGTKIASINGKEWNITFQWNNNVDSGWQPSDVKRMSDYTFEEGLMLTCGIDDNYPPQQDFDYDDVVVRLTSLSKILHPIPPGTTIYQFTVPKDWVKRKQENTCFR